MGLRRAHKEGLRWGSLRQVYKDILILLYVDPTHATHQITTAVGRTRRGKKGTVREVYSARHPD